MTSPIAQSFGQQLDTLAATIRAWWSWPSPDTAFTLYACHAAGVECPVAGDCTPLSETQRRRMDQAPILATTGYGLALGVDMGEEAAAAWSDGLARVASRTAFPTDRNSFFYRPLETLGLALGATSIATTRDADRAWLRTVMVEGEQRLSGTELWVWLWAAKAALMLSCRWHPLPIAPIDILDTPDLALLIWLHAANDPAYGLFRLPAGTVEIETELLKRCALTAVTPSDAGCATILYCALRVSVLHTLESVHAQTWQVGRDVQDATILLFTLCTRFHIFARQLRSRHAQRSTLDINDEYDVQDLMHALLKIHFSDVRSEEWTPSYGGRSTRMDFLLKPERIVIETKMTRPNLDARGVINELTSDKERYRTHPDCGTLVCFIYDPDGRIPNPIALETDLASRPDDLLRVIVIVAPKGT